VQPLDEFAQLLLQGRELGRQFAELVEQIEELLWERGRLLGWPSGRRRNELLWQGSQAATMGAGQQEQVLASQPFDAGIAGMGLCAELSLGQPVAQSFAINSKQTTTVGQRNEGHGATPFVLRLTRTTPGTENSREFSAQVCKEFSLGLSREGSAEICRENRAAVSWNARPPDKPQAANAHPALRRRRR